MYSVRLDDISDEGLFIDQLASRDEWLRVAMEAALGDKRLPTDDAHVTLTLVRSEDQISMIGGVFVTFHPTCDRCLKAFKADEQVPIHIVYAPRAAETRSGAADGPALSEAEAAAQEDIDFSFYDGRSIDISAAVTEQVMLAQPMQYLCTPDCKGLCPTCGKDRNAGPCKCPPPPVDSPFSVLKGLKLPKKKK